MTDATNVPLRSNGLGEIPPIEAMFRLPGASHRDPRIETWFASDDPLRQMMRRWFQTLRALGADVRETLHDGQPTACVADAAFAYVDAFKAHAGLGFFHGAALPDPAKLLEGTGKRMRHVKLRWGKPIDEAALRGLVEAAYADIRRRSST